MINRLKIALSKYGLFILFLIIAVIFVSLGGRKYLDYHELAKVQDQILAFVTARPVVSVLAFMASYFAVTVSMLPGLIALDLIAGFAFPQPISFFIVLFSAWFAAVSLFLASRHAFRDVLKDKGGPWVKRISRGFNRYQDGYLVFLRAFPFFPYGVISIALGFVRISFFKYAWTTFVGIVPSAYIFTMAGQHLGALIAGEFSTSLFLTPKVLILYLVFFLGVMGPLFWKNRKAIPCDEEEEDCK